jgi:methyltransferase
VQAFRSLPDMADLKVRTIPTKAASTGICAAAVCFLCAQYPHVAGRLILFAIVFGSMLAEARRASKNERSQRARGGVEPVRDVYPIMRVVYPGAFVAMFVEGALRGSRSPTAALIGVSLFLAAKSLKWWAILSLGQFWTFRVIVVPGARLVAAGPYRWLRHPNYVGVIGELAGTALVAGAPVSGVAGIAMFGWLIARRISVEDRALREAAR